MKPMPSCGVWWPMLATPEEQMHGANDACRYNIVIEVVKKPIGYIINPYAKH